MATYMSRADYDVNIEIAGQLRDLLSAFAEWDALDDAYFEEMHPDGLMSFDIVSTEQGMCATFVGAIDDWLARAW